MEHGPTCIVRTRLERNLHGVVGGVGATRGVLGGRALGDGGVGGEALHDVLAQHLELELGLAQLALVEGDVGVARAQGGAAGDELAGVGEDAGRGVGGVVVLAARGGAAPQGGGEHGREQGGGEQEARGPGLEQVLARDLDAQDQGGQRKEQDRGVGQALHARAHAL